MKFSGIEEYQITSEYNIAELLSHFDSNYIFDVLEDKLQNISFASSLNEANIVESFESNFKAMNEKFPGDSQNIRTIREQVYRDIIRILTEKFNLQFNTVDDTIDLYTAAYYLYDFTVCNRNKIMINFFTAFIVNNKDSLSMNLNAQDFRKNKDSAAAYGKRIYEDKKFGIISANMNTVINYISELDIKLVNIFQSTYKDIRLVNFLDNAFADKGNFFKDFYCSVLHRPEDLPIVITDIRLLLNKFVSSFSNTANIDDFLAYDNPNFNNTKGE